MRSEDPSQPGLASSANDRGAFLITVDTEGDNLWAKPREITVKNAETLPRFQELCDRYSLKPTYLVNWEMANSEAFVEFGKAVLGQGTAEVGMHLHAWNSPPIAPLTDDDFRYQPYLIEYPERTIREKVKVMTDTLEAIFGVKMTSHRAGRWGLDETYARTLVDAGYRVDCSVTPHKNWGPTRGDPAGKGGPDYRRFPETAYFMDPTDIARPGSSPLLQVPLTVLPLHDTPWARGLRASVGRIPYIRRPLYRSLPDYSWLQPVNNNGDSLVRILEVARERGHDHVEFMVHSSELMAGGSPWFDTVERIETMYGDLEVLFQSSTRDWEGQTLNQYHDEFASTRRRDTQPKAD